MAKKQKQVKKNIRSLSERQFAQVGIQAYNNPLIEKEEADKAAAVGKRRSI